MNPSTLQRRLRPTVLASALATTGLIPLLSLPGNATAQSASPAASTAKPEDPALTALVEPSSSLAVGVQHSSAYSAKANEYNGLDRQRTSLIGELDLRGSDRFDSNGRTRWSVLGRDLGTRSPSLQLEGGVQGSFKARLGYDGLYRNTSDSFQTPYQGIGGSTLRLPGNWVPIVVPQVNATAPNARGLSPAVTASDSLQAGVLRPPTAAQTSAAAALQATDGGAFRQVDLFTRRERFSLGWEQVLSPQWTLSANASRERQTGLKATSAPSRAVGGDTTAQLAAPLDQHDSQLQLSLGWAGERGHWQASYEESIFTNEVKSISWNLWAAPTVVNALSTAPSNRFRKLLLAGSWQLGEATTLTGSASQSRGTQNEAYLNDAATLATTPIMPVASAQALVVSQQAALKLLHRLNRQLAVAAHARFDERENRTPVNTYGFYDLNNPVAAGASPFAYLYPGVAGLGSNLNVNANTPYSRRVHQAGLELDWHPAPQHQIKLAADAQHTSRFCLGSWLNCANAPQSDEQTIKLDWRGTLTDELSASAGLQSARRQVPHYDENAFLALVPMAGKTPSTATGALAGSTAYGTLQSLGLNAFGPVSGLLPAAPAGSALGVYFPLNNVLANALYGNSNRISEPIGTRRWNQADRQRDKLQASLNWQPGERWSLQAGLDGGVENFPRTVYGLQRVTSQAVNLDAGFTASDTLSVNAFASAEDQRTRTAGNSYTANSAAANVNGATTIDGGCFATIALRNASNKIDPCLDWRTHTRDRTFTLGASANASKLMGGKLDLTGSLVWSEGRTDIDVTGGSYVNNPVAGIAGAATRNTAASFIAATPLPTVVVRSLALSGQATWRLDEKQALRLGYSVQRLRSSDWALEGLQDGVLTQQLPTREQAPSFDVHRLGLAYLLSF